MDNIRCQADKRRANLKQLDQHICQQNQAMQQKTNNLDEANFSAPITWIGLYVAAASLVCAIAMAVDVICGFCQHNSGFLANSSLSRPLQ
ncbi:hypothetical protein SADUNF_Sadunf01G0098800 [Salix dunnii]|uniref:Uncharacterized protein n=1 Tax=Salix dunnii TaxID=1413687 RepID=A0A835NBG9_9ROSI|nr:hypothetical protein SADUNF_Sadunf01G0098800 [Salix dunnii]